MRTGAQTSVLFSDGWESLRGAVRKVRRSARRFCWSSICSECAGTNLMQLPLVERRQRLEDVLNDLHPCLQLILQASDPNQASEWLGEVPGLEGVVAKRADGRYRPGRREWIKVKRRRTADCVVVGRCGR